MARSALVNEDDLVGARQGHEVRQKIVMRRSRASMNNHQRRSMPHDLVIDQDTIGIHKSFLDRIDVVMRCAGGRCFHFRGLSQGRAKHEKEDKNKGCIFHVAHYSRSPHPWFTPPLLSCPSFLHSSVSPILRKEREGWAPSLFFPIEIIFQTTVAGAKARLILNVLRHG